MIKKFKKLSKKKHCSLIFVSYRNVFFLLGFCCLKCSQFVYLGFDIMFLYSFSYILAFIFCCNFVKQFKNYILLYLIVKVNLELITKSKKKFLPKTTNSTSPLTHTHTHIHTHTHTHTHAHAHAHARIHSTSKAHPFLTTRRRSKENLFVPDLCTHPLAHKIFVPWIHFRNNKMKSQTHPASLIFELSSTHR